MKTKLFLMMLVAFGALSSCSKDEDPAPLTKEQATVEIADLKANYTSEIAAMDNKKAGHVPGFFVSRVHGKSVFAVEHILYALAQ